MHVGGLGTEVYGMIMLRFSSTGALMGLNCFVAKVNIRDAFVLSAVQEAAIQQTNRSISSSTRATRD
jgi:hypothetical protein